MRRRFSVIVASVLLLASVLAGGLLAAQRFIAAPVGGDGVVTFLLIGGDDGPFRGGTVLEADADAFHLLAVSPSERRATFVNVPRDAWIDIPRHGRDKLSQCLKSGPERCVETAETLWDIEVDHFLLTEFNGLKTAVDRFGGIPIEVPYAVSDGGQAVSAGSQRINGSQALAFARDRRNRPGHDFARTAAQAELLRAAHRTMIEEKGALAQVTELAGLVRQTTVSDLSPGELLRYAYLARRISPENVASVTLDASVGFAGQQSVVYLSDSAGETVRNVVADAAPGSPDG